MPAGLAIDPWLPYCTRRGLRQGWLDLLNRYNWRYFVTGTFAPDLIRRPTPERIQKLINSMLHEVNRACWGRRWKKRTRGFSLVAVLERHKSGEFHVHMLMDAPEDASDFDVAVPARVWWWRKCGRLDCGAVTDKTGLLAYFLKDVGKGSDVHFSASLAPA